MDGPTAVARRSNVWIVAALCLAFAAISIQYSAKVHNSDRPKSQSAFLRWRPQIRHMSQEVNIWEHGNWPNPPIMALILKPFMDVEPELWGSQLWLLTKAVCATIAIFLVLSMLDRPEHPFPLWGRFLAVLLAIRPIEGDLVHGNVNLFILLTVVLGIHAFSRGWDIAAGLWIALGIACKLTPALFLPFLLWKRAWKSLAASAAGLVLFLFLVPSLYFGWQRNLDCLTSWTRGMVLPFLVKNEVTSEHQNQSLPGLLERMFRERPSFSQPSETGDVPTDYHHIADVEPWVLGLTMKACLGLFCLAVLLRCRAPLEERTDWRWMAEFGVVVLGMLIFSERTWKHHAVTLLIPFAVLAHQLSAFRLPPGRRLYLVATTVAVVLLMLTTASGFGDGQDWFSKRAQVYGAYTWSFLLLLASMLYLAGSRANAPLRLPSSSGERSVAISQAA